jgi:hypothetical protein
MDGKKASPLGGWKRASYDGGVEIDIRPVYSSRPFGAVHA